MTVPEGPVERVGQLVRLREVTRADAERLGLLFELFSVVRVEASTDGDSVAEQRSLEKAGFTREGALRQAQHRAGAHHDLVVYSVVRGPTD